MMGYGNESDDRTDPSDKDIDTNINDLNAWEYLTANFDDVGFLKDSTTANCVEPQFGANKTNAFRQEAFSCPQTIHATKERVNYNRQDVKIQLREQMGQDGVIYSQNANYFSTGTHHIGGVTSSSSPFRFCIHIISQPKHSLCYQVPPTEAVIRERNMFSPNNFASMRSTNNGDRKSLHQSSVDQSEFCRDAYHLNTPGISSSDLSVSRSCEMVSLLSNPFGLLRQNPTSSGATLLSFNRIEAHQSILYAPPLPPHKLLKPLTAYHYFYRVERDNIVQGMTINGDQIPDAVHDYSESKLRELLDRRWYIDPNKKKRAHRKTLGELGFEK